MNSTVTAADRLGLTLCLAILLHAVIVMGVSFQREDPPPVSFESMEVILVDKASNTPVENPQYLANANQEGGGDSEHADRPAIPLSAPLTDPTPRISMAAPEPPTPTSAEPVEPSPAPTHDTLPDSSKAREVLTAETEPPSVPPATKSKQVEPKPVPERRTARSDRRQQSDAPTETVVGHESQPAPNAAALIASSFQMASLDAEIAARVEAKAKRPRRKFVSANTTEYRFAAYMEAWRAKVERVGNLNYPDEARRNQLTGSLILDVALNADGSLNELTLRRPSGHKVLDDAALRIVKLAAPFAPFPADFNADVDILHITRTWQFLNSNQFSSR